MHKSISLTLALLIILSSMTMSADGHSKSHGAHPIKQALSHEGRLEREQVRDKKRKPDQVLALMELKPGMRVGDLGSGFGYYTDMLSQLVGPTGKVIAHNTPYVVERFSDTYGQGGPWEQRFTSASWAGRVEQKISKVDEFKVEEPLDALLIVLHYHDLVWMDEDRPKMNKALYNSLKPGGVFVVIDHSAENGSGGRDVETLHRVDKQLVIDELTQAGFKLVGDYDFLANPEDTRDFNVFRDARTNRDATDRFVLKFKKD